MGDWYTIGLALGLGTALGVLFAGLFSTTRVGRIAAIVLAGAAGGVVGWLIEDWTEIVAGVIGGLVGAAAAAVVVMGARRRGGTRGGLALIVAAVSAALAALAFVPVVGYLTAAAVPGLAARLRRTSAEKYAGLRSLARD